MTDKWIGPRVLCGDSNPLPDGYEYVRRYADDVRLGRRLSHHGRERERLPAM